MRNVFKKEISLSSGKGKVRYEILGFGGLTILVLGIYQCRYWQLQSNRYVGFVDNRSAQLRQVTPSNPVSQVPSTPSGRSPSRHEERGPLSRKLSKEYRAVFDVRGKPFPSEAERRSLEDHLSDPRLIRETFELLGSKEGFFKAEDNGSFHAERIEAIEFVAQTLNWEKNPIRSEVIERLDGLIFAGEPAGGLSREEKRAWIGDKIEYFSLMLQSDPKRAQNVLVRAKGTSLDQVLKFSFRRTKALKGDKA